ncbi:uncharacterized protein LOC128385816 [Panonychus citri]|uniref:uncharacterized protein LOC128385816 n=1 Tax=Panonychus citri TaxID=50023 RepID=UPI0023076829|nr:uncharacterized protein LOC128385816 [Panonychus citri]
MSLNDLPDICLWKIFGNFHEAKDLIRLSKVCSRWSDLITPRFRRVKYLQMMDVDSNEVDYINANSLWINPNTNWNDYNLFEWFPNIKGLIGMDHLLKDGYLENIEMCAPEFNFDYKKVFRPDQLKQVHSRYFYMDDLPSFIEYFPNLKRLHLNLCKEDPVFYNFCEVFYNGLNLSALKILGLCTNGFAAKFNGFHFMNFCPSLESAFFLCMSYDIHEDEPIKNYNLRDLVIENLCFGCFLWPPLKKLVSKFPNLQHLAIRNFDMLDDSHLDLEELIQLIPKLKILDLRKCEKVTQKSADFLSKYCVKENRSIALYYDCENEPTEWPKLVDTYEPICYGFDFMKHCFYKNFSYHPYLIDE